MRVKLLRGDGEATVLLVHPATLDEYAGALDRLGRAERPPADGCGVVTTAEQRARWELPDLAASGRAQLVDSAQAFALLAGPTAEPETSYEPSAGPAAGAAPRRSDRDAVAALAAVRALDAPGTQVDQALATLDDAGLPAAARQTLRRQVREALDSRSEAVSEALDRSGKALTLPWRTSEPQGFDPRRLQRALDHSHGALAQVKTRIRDVLAACPQTRALLTVERPDRGPTAAAGAPLALAVRPGPPEAPGSVLCLAGPKGTGKTSLAEVAARALGRTHVRATLEGANAERLIRGSEGAAAGRIVKGLCEAGVNNPVFVLEAVDRVEPDAAGALLYLLDPARRTAFRDAYLDVAFDLSAVLWIVTATDPGAIPEPVREHLAGVELPACTEEEKLAIAQQHLLTRPFDAPAPDADAWLPPGSPAPPALIELAAAADGPAVVAEREVASVRELEVIAAQPPSSDGVEAWRTAACDGEVRFETEAIVRVVRDHTNEAGVAELNRKLAAVCRHVVSRRPPGGGGPEVITEATVRKVLGDGDGDALPPAVRAAIESERQRFAKSSDGDAAASNHWIDWLEHLPWNRRSDAPTDLAQARAALDAGHAGLGEAKTRIVEYLAVRRRNPRGPGAECVASALGRGFAKLACGGLRDETDLRGHNRTWKGAQPGSILRELRRIGRKDPVFVLDELDKLGKEPAAVLLEVLDRAQHHRFRDAFVELPFDLSEALFITTANDPDRIRPALRDRLEVIDLPGYAEAEKVAIARTHLIDAQKRAAGLEAVPLRVTDGACRRIIRDYTSEQGVRQLARCLQAICRKVALGLETGDAALVRDRITAAQVRTFLGEPDAAHSDGLGRLRQRLDDPALPRPVRVRGRRVLAQLSACAPTDPEHHRARDYLDRLLSVPWMARASAPLDLARAHAVLDAGHAGHEAARQRLLDQLAVRFSNPGAGFPAICLSGPPGVGKSALARLVAAALRRPCPWLSCGGLDSAAVHGVRSVAPGRIVEELRRAGVHNPVFVLDEVDRLDEAGGAAAALLEALDPDPAVPFRDRYLDIPLDLSEILGGAGADAAMSRRGRTRPVEVTPQTVRRPARRTGPRRLHRASRRRRVCRRRRADRRRSRVACSRRSASTSRHAPLGPDGDAPAVACDCEESRPERGCGRSPMVPDGADRTGPALAVPRVSNSQAVASKPRQRQPASTCCSARVSSSQGEDHPVTQRAGPTEGAAGTGRVPPPRTGWRHATDGRANAPETVSFPRARTHGCRLRQAKKVAIRPGSDNLPPLPSTASNRRTDPPLGTPAIRARATPRTGHIRILVLPARNQPRAAPLAHLLDEQREAEPNALAKNPRAGHVELGHRQVELLELTRRDPQLECPIQRFSVRFPDWGQRHHPPPSPHAPRAPASWTGLPRARIRPPTPAAATGGRPVRPAACRTSGRAPGPRRLRRHRAPRRAPGRAGEEPPRGPPCASGAAPHAQCARSPATRKPPGPDPAPGADGHAPDASASPAHATAAKRRRRPPPPAAAPAAVPAPRRRPACPRQPPGGPPRNDWNDIAQPTSRRS